MRRPRRRTECVVCLIKTQELDPTGRCACCAAVRSAMEARTSYGKYMAKRAREEEQNAED